MRFGRKKDRDAGHEDALVAGPTTPEDAQPDPSTWALPPDAAVTAPQDTEEADAVAPATAAGGLSRAEAPEAPEPSTTVSGAGITSPSLGADAAPRAAAAANADPAPSVTATPAPAPAWSAPATPSSTLEPKSSGSALAAILEHPTVKKHPEILVAGAFVGAFVVARILKRISE